jgi:hypothetical protein
LQFFEQLILCTLPPHNISKNLEPNILSSVSIASKCSTIEFLNQFSLCKNEEQNRGDTTPTITQEKEYDALIKTFDFQKRQTCIHNPPHMYLQWNHNHIPHHHHYHLVSS